MSQRAAFLIRCSTKKQDYQRQITDLTSLAKRFGYEYSDATIYGEHITGKDDATKRDRASIAKLKQDAVENKFDLVLVSEVSRMSRDVQSGTQYVRELTNMDKPIYFKDIDTWTIDPVTHKPTPNATEVITNSFLAAWKYLKSMKTQIASGRRYYLSTNQITIGIPYFGYKRKGGKDRDTKNLWVIDEPKAEVVREVFNEYLKENGTIRTVAFALNDKYKALTGKKLSIGTVAKMLMYDTYATGIRVIYLEDPDTKDKERFDVEIPTIIDKEVYDKAAAKRGGNRITEHPYPKQHCYTLSKLLKCPCCGYTLTPRKSVGRATKSGLDYISWHCMSAANNMSACNASFGLENRKAEALIWELIKNVLIGYVNADSDDKLTRVEELDAKIEVNSNEITALENRKAENAKIIKKAYDGYMAGKEADEDMALKMYQQTLKEVKDDNAGIDVAIYKLIDVNNRLKIERESLTKPQYPADIVARAEADDMEKRRVIKELVSKIQPYKITTLKSPASGQLLKKGVFVLEVFTVGGIYYILYNGNQKTATKYAYYISSNNAYYMDSNTDSYPTATAIYGKGESFYIPYGDMLLTDGTEGEVIVDFARMQEICRDNNMVFEL